MRAVRETMLGLIVSQVILFSVSALIGFAIGWRIYASFAHERRRTDSRTNEQLRQALTEAQVRRARAP